MDIVDVDKVKGTKSKNSVTADKKAKARTLLSPPASIISYFKPPTMPGMNKHSHKDHDILTINASDSQREKSTVEQNMKTNVQPDCSRESLSCVQQPNVCKDSGTLSVESKSDCCTQTLQHSKHQDNENKSKESDDCHVHHHDNDLQDDFSHHGDSSCIEDGDTSSCKHLDDVHVVDCSDNNDDDDRSCTTSLKLHKPQPNKSKWSFTWKKTKKCSKVPEPKSSDDDSDPEVRVVLAAVHSKIDSQKTVRPGIVQKKCTGINRSKANKKKMNNSTKTASKDENVILINNLETTECSLNNTIDDVNTSGGIISISGGFVVKHGQHDPEPQQTLSNNDIKGCINDIDLPPPLTPKVSENSCDIEADIESASCKLQKGRKSLFDVLMQSSRDRASTKLTSPENLCEKTEMDLSKSEEVERRIVEVKGKDFKKSACGEKSDIKSVSENCKKDGLKRSNTSCKKLQAKGKSYHAQNGSEMIEDESECCGIGSKHVRRQSSRISAKATRNGKLNLEILDQSSPESKILRKRRKGKCCAEANTIPVSMANNNIGVKKQSESNLSSHSNKDQINPLTEREIQGIKMDVNCGDENKSDDVRNEHVVKKATGPIAPIFLAGAWRRGKKKVEQEQLQESLVEVEEISDTTAMLEEKTDSLNPKSYNVYSPIKDVSQNMQEFMGMFRKSPTKSNVAVVQLIDAPFPRVSHVLQVDDEFQQKWGLHTFNDRFVKEEFFISTDENYSNNVKVMSLSELLLSKVQTSQEKAFNWKGSQTKSVIRMSKVEKKAAVACLEKVYPGVSVKKLFKRCHLQLERCRKAELETGKSDRHFVDRRDVEARLSSKNDESRQSASERKTFTQISEKKSCTATEGKKIGKEKEGPLLMAFRKQSRRNQSSCGEEDAKISNNNKKKQPSTKGSLRHYFVLPPKIIDDSLGNPVIEQVLAKSSKSKRKHGDEESNVCRRKANSRVTDSTVEESKKRQRESREPVESLDEIVVDSIGPSKKKVKVMMIDGQDSKQRKKGEKGKTQDRGKTTESSKDVSQDSAKSPKISSDEDFVKTSRRGSRCTTRNVKGTKRASRDSGEAEEDGVRKSRRLQTKLATKEESEKEMSETEYERQTRLETDEKEIVEEEEEVRELNITETEAKVSHVEKQPSSETSCEIQDDIGVGQGPPVLWTECFKPAKSEEILGNNTGGCRLKKWLSEWKSLREKKLNKMQRLQEKKKKRLAARENDGNAGNEWWYEDDEADDFDFSDDSDDSDEDDILCNTMLLTGPTGCGKTSAVYACAEELGFKVIEVNSSSKRGGKYILSELQEATQSYQVAGKRADGIFPPVSTSNARSNDCGISKRVNENVKKGRKDRRVKKKENAKKKLQKESQSAGTPEGQMSLILLDEVDILFEEDKGFWVAVNSLRLNSKRPIVMTASDPCINIDGRFEHIKSPSLIKVRAAHLQNVCLSKDVFVNPAEIQALAILHHGDVRQSLLSLQFWVDSYAGDCDPHGTSFKTETPIYSRIPKICDKQVSSLASAINERDNNTSLSKRPLAKDFQKPEHSKELSTTIESHGTADRQISDVQEHDVAPSHSVNFLVHRLCVESLLGLRNVASAGEGALKVLSLRGEGDMLEAKHSFVCKSSVTSHCQELGFDIARCNLETLLPCLFAWDCNDSIGENDRTKVTKLGQEQSTLKLEQINENTDDKGRSDDLLETFQRDESVFDDERDEGHRDTCELDVVDATKQHSCAVAAECLTVEPEVESKTQPKKYGIRKKLGTISLQAFDHFLEDMSFLDSDLCCDVEAELRTRNRRFGNRHAQVIPGVEDQVDTKSAQLTCKTRATLAEIRGALEVASLQSSHQRFHDSIEKAGPEFGANSLDLISKICDTESEQCPAFEIKNGGNTNEDWTDSDSFVPTGAVASNSSLRLFTPSEIFMSKTKRKREQDLAAVTRHLPDAIHPNLCSMAMDYLPTLRNICRNENNRKASRTKRRFYHYFDMVGLNVPESTIQLLTNDTLSKCRQDMK